jgi:hypothetical protein
MMDRTSSKTTEYEDRIAEALSALHSLYTNTTFRDAINALLYLTDAVCSDIQISAASSLVCGRQMASYFHDPPYQVMHLIIMRSLASPLGKENLLILQGSKPMKYIKVNFCASVAFNSIHSLDCSCSA